MHAYRGVLNIVHGTHDTVNRILDHKDIKAISFVGSDAAGRYIYERGSASGKRVQVRVPPPRSRLWSPACAVVPALPACLPTACRLSS